MANKLFVTLSVLGTFVYAAADETPDTSFVFTDVVTVKTTPVKDQNKSGTCWCFCGTSFAEEEILRKGGKELDLSEMFTVRNCYIDKAKRYVRMYGECNFAAGGSALDVAHVWDNYGVVPEEAYPGIKYGEKKHVHAELDALLSAYVKTIASRPGKKISPVWLEGFEGILDAYLGKVPETFTVDGKTYTPQSYAESLGLNMSDYVGITSFTHHPFYKEFMLEIPDNWINAGYMNVPMEEMRAIVDNALDKGYTVAWAADVSEPGFKWYKGVALMPEAKDESNLEGSELSRWVKLSDKDRANEAYEFNGPVKEIEVTQELRQKMFDNQETTDDHGMVIVGKAVDQKGNKYYKVKNSWDTNQVYEGYIYVSEPYFLAKTLDIYVHKDAIPSAIAKKF